MRDLIMSYVQIFQWLFGETHLGDERLYVRASHEPTSAVSGRRAAVQRGLHPWQILTASLTLRSYELIYSS